MKSNEIYSRQNQDKFLKIQYAARVNYNSAENFNKYAWLLCLISAFSIFLPRTWHEYILNGIPFAADLVAMVCSLIASDKVKWGATFRKYFDAYVLDISTDQFSETDVREILEKSEKIFLKSPEIGRIQISNAGHDSPPGVKDWYEFSELLDGIEAQFECQRQNIWWNKKMSKLRIFATACLGVTVVFTFMLLIYATSNSMLSILLCCGGIIGKIIERLIENIQYFHVSELIIGSQRTVEVHPTKESIEQLQCFIDERRAINVLESNYFHQKIAAKLSDIYKRIAS